MPTIYVAFSGGVDSTYLIHKLLNDNKKYNIQPCFINVTGVMHQNVSDMLAVDNICKYFEDNIDSYQGSINPVKYLLLPNIPGTPMRSMEQTIAVNNLNQHINAVLGLMVCRKDSASSYAPVMAMGWLKVDCAEVTLNRFDKTLDQFQKLMDLPPYIGGISGLDAMASSIVCPLWEMTKREIWDDLPEPLKEMVSFNGFGDYQLKTDTVTNKIHAGKIAEYKESGIDIKDPAPRTTENMSFITRMASCAMRVQDIPGAEGLGLTDDKMKQLQVQYGMLLDYYTTRVQLVNSDTGELKSAIFKRLKTLHDIFSTPTKTEESNETSRVLV